MIRIVLCLGFWLLATAVNAQETQPVLSGDIRIHDPSIIVVDGDWVAWLGGPGAGAQDRRP
jgi:hypothetical protein